MLQIVAVFIAMMLLSSCTSSNLNDGLRPSRDVGNVNSQNNSTPLQEANNRFALIPNDSALVQTQKPSPGVAFLPVVGPPQFAVSSLSSAVRKSARNNAITIISNGQPGASYQVKGYFSALDDGSGTILVFIWDILDRSGKTLHRISGEERTGSRKTDPWAAIDTQMIDRVVARTMLNLRQWINTTT
ncbi:MAG: hypothetical protein GY761_14330 [Hyphomicrobiales bacterium]|nr:hypothetical protein [Hyphomicrobiales bacterium]